MLTSCLALAGWFLVLDMTWLAGFFLFLAALANSYKEN